jgi:peptidoglycan/LPS O-acetylase OafA/YrhL
MTFAWETFWGVPFGLLCVGMAIHPSRLLSNRLTRYLGTISFSLYLVHANILYEAGQAGIYRWIAGFVSGDATGTFVLSAVISIAAIAAVASATYKFIEVPGMKWGKRHKAPAAVSAVA